VADGRWRTAGREICIGELSHSRLAQCKSCGFLDLRAAALAEQFAETLVERTVLLLRNNPRRQLFHQQVLVCAQPRRGGGRLASMKVLSTALIRVW